MKSFPWGRALLATAFFAAIGAITWQGVKKKEGPPVIVDTVEVQRQTVVRKVIGAGKVQPQSQVKISSSITGDLVALKVREGDRVRRGQYLGQIDAARYRAMAKREEAVVLEARAQVESAKARLEMALREAERVSGLLGKGLAATAELEAAQGEVAVARATHQASLERAAGAGAAWDDARTTLARTTLYSPIEGTVIALYREVGERVRGSDFDEDVVMVIAALSTLEVRVEVGEHDVVLIKSGLPAEVEIDAIEGKKFVGQVIEVAQNAVIKNQGTEAEVTNFPVTVLLEGPVPGALPGMSATVTIASITREDVVAVPIQCVSARPEDELLPGGPKERPDGPPKQRGKEKLVKVVFVVEDDVAHVRRVETGISSDVAMEIVSGLKPGEKVVSGPYKALSRELKDGARIKIKSREPSQGNDAKPPAAAL